MFVYLNVTKEKNQLPVVISLSNCFWNGMQNPWMKIFTAMDICVPFKTCFVVDSSAVFSPNEIF